MRDDIKFYLSVSDEAVFEISQTETQSPAPNIKTFAALY